MIKQMQLYARTLAKSLVRVKKQYRGKAVKNIRCGHRWRVEE